MWAHLSHTTHCDVMKHAYTVQTNGILIIHPVYLWPAHLDLWHQLWLAITAHSSIPLWMVAAMHCERSPSISHIIPVFLIILLQMVSSGNYLEGRIAISNCCTFSPPARRALPPAMPDGWNCCVLSGLIRKALGEWMDIDNVRVSHIFCVDLSSLVRS